MAITLEGIVLPDLVIDDEFHWAGIQSEVNSTLDGGLVIWEQEKAGKLIDLVGRSDTAWITRQVLVSIRDLAQVARATYTLDYEGTIYIVRFRHEEGEVVSAVPVVERPNPSDDDWYSNVRIRLMEV